MSSATSAQAVADTLNESHPAYTGELNYIDGYDPVSYEAPHSSLLKARTWLGMGLVLAALCPAGIIIFGAALGIYGNIGLAGTSPSAMLIIGAVFTIILLIVGSLLISSGRRDYHRYVKATGRRN